MAMPIAYPGDSTSKRLAFVVNNKFPNTKYERRGAEVDERNLTDLLQTKLNYDVTVINDKTCEETIEELKTFANNEKHKMSDHALVVLMSHGNETGIQLGSDNLFVSIGLLAVYLNPFNAPLLANKPKLFIVNACRGNVVDDNKAHICHTEVGDDECDENSADFFPAYTFKTSSNISTCFISKEADFFILYSTPHEHALQCDNDLLLNVIKAKMKFYLKTDVDIIVKHWKKFGVSRTDNWANFYNSNLTVKDEKGQTVTNINSFTDLFRDRRYKRMLLSADAGYGKSTFVHEMVHQWVDSTEWTEKFSCVFLFRLGEISLNSDDKKHSVSLKDLLQKCLSAEEAEMFIINDELYNKSLFVFDGFDELQEDVITEEFHDLIVGKYYNTPYIMLTSRPEGGFHKIKEKWDMHIELKGFTVEYVAEQLKKFGELSFDMAKVPLFMTLFEILHKKSGVEIIIQNPCSLIQKMIEYLISRYQENDMNFTYDDKNELFNCLGRCALTQIKAVRQSGKRKISLFDDAELGVKTNFRIKNAFRKNNYLAVAKSAHLILDVVFSRVIFFPHRMFADYFAAFFWKKYLGTDFEFGGHGQRIVWPKHNRYNYCFDSSSWFSAFLTLFNERLKSAMWSKVKEIGQIEMRTGNNISVPLFGEYESLDPVVLGRSFTVIDFVLQYDQMSHSAMEKLTLSPSVTELTIVRLPFTDNRYSVKFKNIKVLNLHQCRITLSGNEFIDAYNIDELHLFFCTFENGSNVSDFLMQFQAANYNLVYCNPTSEIADLKRENMSIC